MSTRALTDGSNQMATEMGAEVIDLDMSRPFTAARARNEGLRQLLLHHPDVDFVQFVDGDCEVVPGWLEAARDFLRDSPLTRRGLRQAPRATSGALGLQPDVRRGMEHADR